MKRGFTLIELMIVIAIIAIIAAIAIPNLIEARKGGNETSAIGSLKTLISSQGLYRERNMGGFTPNSRYAPSLSGLANANLIDDVLSSGSKSGYAFAMAGSTFTWTGTASPNASQGDRYFFADHSGVIRFTTGGAASASSPAVQ